MWLLCSSKNGEIRKKVNNESHLTKLYFAIGTWNERIKFTESRTTPKRRRDKKIWVGLFFFQISSPSFLYRPSSYALHNNYRIA